MSEGTERSTISARDQARIDSAVKLGATKQVQLVRFIYEELGAEGIVKFVERHVTPWAKAWARQIKERRGLKSEQITARMAIQELYPEVHDHTAICSDHLDMFFSVDHEDLQECGARYCPVAYQWMEVWPEGAHLLCYIYSYSFDKAFFEELNPALFFTKHAECSAEQEGIPHGRRCLMRLETKDKPVMPEATTVIEDPASVVVAPCITEFLSDRNIDYLPNI
jgi:hypothetical protein